MADITIAFPQPIPHHNFPSGCQFRPLATPKPNIFSPEEPKDRTFIWNSIQNTQISPPPYIHPLVRHSLTLMSQKSLELCTENLGSETGSDGFSSGDEFDFFSSPSKTEQKTEDETGEVKQSKKELSCVNYHCSVRPRSPPRSFPPPLPSISRRDGHCLKMRPLRRDGRLVVEAVPVPSQTYLHAERHHGRLLLSFINSSSPSIPLPHKQQQEIEEFEIEEEIEEEIQEEEEEVEVVDRGTIVEVKVSNLAAVKVHRSSLVINKFVVGSPLTAADVKVSAATTTAESKLLFASRRLRREDMLHDMRRCSELRRPLFIFEQPHCIATSS